jgi:hypothetical protein
MKLAGVMEAACGTVKARQSHDVRVSVGKSNGNAQGVKTIELGAT